MNSIRIRNLRSLVDTGSVAIKPITLLIGANSSGKSTFLRALPLLRQSVETPTSSPILWFGRFVDFGSLQDACNRNNREAGVTFEFSFDLAAEGGSTFTPSETLPVTVAATIGQLGEDDSSRITEISINVAGHSVLLRFGETGLLTTFLVNDRNIYKTLQSDAMELTKSALFIPSIVDTRSDTQQHTLLESAVDSPLFVTFRRRRAQSQFLSDLLRQSFRPLFHGNTKDRTVSSVANRIRLGTSKEMLALVKRYSSTMYRRDFVGTMSEDNQFFRSLRDAAIAIHVPAILDISDRYISRLAKSITYMGPLRATAQRYYRLQDLSVREVDFQGENLGMFLRSLTESERRAFASFSREHLDFDVGVQTTRGHVEIRVHDHGSSDDVNLADVGFGFSQVIPVVAQVWSAVSRRLDESPRSTGPILAIEQPELHLHPRFQARLADLLAGAIRESRSTGKEMRCFVETHSEALVNRFGALVRAGTIDPDNIQLLLFTFDPDSGRTDLSTASYDADGALRDWPYGFFSP